MLDDTRAIAFMISRLRSIDRSDIIPSLYRRETCGEAAVHVLGERFVIGMGWAISLFTHANHQVVIVNPAVLVASFEATFQGLAIESFHVPVLISLSRLTKKQGKLGPLDSGVEKVESLTGALSALPRGGPKR
jgi:hypothetical protein